MLRVVVASAVAVVLASGAAFAAPAATLSSVSGPVLVDGGKGFVKVSSASEVAPGSRILVSKGGKATLAYADGCVKALSANSITTVVKSDACKASAQVAASGPGEAVYTEPVAPAVVAAPSYNWLIPAAAGLAAGGLAGYLIGENQSDTVYVPVSN